jgi:hypothetical protein
VHVVLTSIVITDSTVYTTDLNKASPSSRSGILNTRILFLRINCTASCSIKMVTFYNLPPDPEPLTPSATDESLSPSDGYFQDRSLIPQEVFVQDPTTTETSKGKAKEADRDKPSNRPYTPYTPTSSTSAGSLGRRYRDEDDALESSPLLDNTIPPPAYEAALAGQIPPQNNGNANQEFRGLENGFNALEIGPVDVFRRGGDGRTPESMRGGRPFCDRERYPGVSERRCCGFGITRKLIRRVLLILLVLSVGTGLLCAVSESHEVRYTLL